MLLLLNRHGQLVMRDEFMSILWPNSFVDEANLTGTIWLIRQALGDRHRWVQTVPKRGYRFVGEVTAPARATGETGMRHALTALAVLATALT